MSFSIILCLCSLGLEKELKQLVEAIRRLVPCGAVDLKPPALAVASQYQDPSFRMPTPTNGEETARNIPAFHILHGLFLKVCRASV